MYLVDTNVWLERLLSQAKSAEVAKFLNRVPSNELYITDFGSVSSSPNVPPSARQTSVITGALLS